MDFIDTKILSFYVSTWKKKNFNFEKNEKENDEILKFNS